MSKVNKAEIRRNAATKLVAFFEASGSEYHCSASIYNVIDPLSLQIAQELLSNGICLSKSAYSFNLASNMASMFSTDAAKILYNKKYGK